MPEDSGGNFRCSEFSIMYNNTYYNTCTAVVAESNKKLIAQLCSVTIVLCKFVHASNTMYVVQNEQNTHVHVQQITYRYCS